MRRTDVATAPNASVRPIVEYGLEPRGASLVARLTGALAGGVSGRDATRVLDPVRRFNGVAATPQRFVGVAPLGVSRTVTPSHGRIDGEPSIPTFDNTALRIFAERLRRNGGQ